MKFGTPPLSIERKNMNLPNQLTSILAAAVPAQRVAQAGIDLTGIVELVVVIAIAITNWWYKKKKADNE